MGSKRYVCKYLNGQYVIVPSKVRLAPDGTREMIPGYTLGFGGGMSSSVKDEKLQKLIEESPYYGVEIFGPEHGKQAKAAMSKFRQGISDSGTSVPVDGKEVGKIQVDKALVDAAVSKIRGDLPIPPSDGVASTITDTDRRKEEVEKKE